MAYGGGRERERERERKKKKDGGGKTGNAEPWFIVNILRVLFWPLSILLPPGWESKAAEQGYPEGN